MRVKMCSVHVDDPATAFEFYTTVLGFDPLMVKPEYFLYIVRSPEDRNGVGLLLEPSDNPIAKVYKEGLYASDMAAIVLGVPDVQAEYDRLSGLGVRFLGAPTSDPYGVSAIFDDTCGNLIQLHQDERTLVG
ncbi:VOC family protein [Luethyella okanaganae]|uniref:VOC family protein n=1 Tax=Luethyella okanaganae TaxID=69372 RepID=A0ABW1VG98_9MICO